MLPDFLSSSYKRYKQDTALFTTWLAKAAASIGYKPEAKEQQRFTPNKAAKPSSQVQNVENLKPSARLKGKDRKAAKAAAGKVTSSNGDNVEVAEPTTVKYSMTTASMLRQAKAILQSSERARVQMPASLRKVVERAIEARQRCSEWFQKSQIRNKYADKTHAHFIEILKQSLEILEPCMEVVDSTEKHRKQGAPVHEGSTGLANRFAALNVEESPDNDPTEVAEVSATVHVVQKSSASNGNPTVAVYELEDEEAFDDDWAFVIYCFFEDLHRIQDFVRGLWVKYKAKSCDLHTAAMTTNAAFGLVRQSEDDLLAQAPKMFDKKRSWDTIAIIIFYADAFEQGVCPEARLNSTDTLRVTPFDDFIYLSTARILMKFTFLADLPQDCHPGYPVPCMPMRYGYISRPELLGTPEMDEKEEEDLKLSRYIIDRHLWKTCQEASEEASTPPLPPEDDFNRSLDGLLGKGILSVALVFQARVYLDIQSVMGDDVSNGYKDLLTTTSEIDKIMNLRVIDGAWDVGGSGERWHERDTDVVMRIKMTSIHWILDSGPNLFPEFKKHMLAAHAADSGKRKNVFRPTVRSPAGTQVHSDTQSATKKEPFRSSTTSHRKNPKFNTVSNHIHQIPAGIDINHPDFAKVMRKRMAEMGQLRDDEPVDPQHEENYQKLNIKRIEPSADLRFLLSSNPIYCGLVSFSMLTDFETAGISLCNWHKTIWPTAHLYNALRQTSNVRKTWPEMEHLTDLHMEALFAGYLPLSAYEFYVRFALALGLSISNFSRNPRRRTNADRLRFRQGANGTKLKITQMSSIFRQYFDGASLDDFLVNLDRFMRDPGPRASRKEKEIAKRPLTSLQFLGMLAENLPGVTHRLQFDYITLTKHCAKLLKTIRQQIELQSQIFLPRVPTEDSADQILTFLVMQILEENNDMAEDNGLGPMIGPQLEIAGEEMRKFLNTYRPEDLISNFNTLPRKARAPSGLVPNHWNISIRHVSLSPPGDLVFFVQPDSEYVHSEGPIQIAEGQPRGHTLNPKSLATLQTIAKLIMKAFLEGMGAGSDTMLSVPWSWATNEPNFARRIVKVMTDMGVREDLMSMSVADAGELAKCDEAWDNLSRQLMGFIRQ